jgi:uncharacterized protein
MKGNLAAGAAGTLFGIGLAISGMTKPSKVAGFLDLAGAWDASLMFVMIGAIAIHFVAHKLVLRRSSPLFDTKFHLPSRKDLDPRLLGGAVLFGIGWGLGGFCPGPGLVSAASGSSSALVFVVGLTIGLLIEHATARAMTRPAPAAPAEAAAEQSSS